MMVPYSNFFCGAGLMPTQQQLDWVKNTLHFQVAGKSGNAASGDFGKLINAYRAAASAVDRQVSALQNDLLDYDDEDLNRIASDELNTIFRDERVELEEALEDGPGDRLAGLASTYAAYLRGSRRVATCDANPFGVSVAIVATLGPVLDQISAAAKAARA
jgi:hypothetical protein